MGAGAELSAGVEPGAGVPAENVTRLSRACLGVGQAEGVGQAIAPQSGALRRSPLRGDLGVGRFEGVGKAIAPQSGALREQRTRRLVLAGGA